MAFITTAGRVGMNVSFTYPGTTTDGENAPYALGTIADGTDGQRYVFCQAGAAISTTTNQPFFLAIDENFQAVKITKALAIAGHRVGVAPQVIISDNDFFWAILGGANFNCKVAVSCAADITLWTTATAGVLDDTSGATHVAVFGVVIAVAASTSASAGSTVREAVVAPGGMLVTEV
jgi:hypothetical protein